MPNERVSRDAIREKPPNILITNYSMLEYMCIRPNDDAVFCNAKLRFVVLDEAYIYKDATGIETSMLVRHVETRLTDKGHSPQYILTSATLGDESSNPQIFAFGKRLCGHSFQSIIHDFKQGSNHWHVLPSPNAALPTEWSRRPHMGQALAVGCRQWISRFLHTLQHTALRYLDELF